MIVTLRLLKQCFYQTTEYGPAIFVLNTEITAWSYTYTPTPSDLDFCQHIMPPFMLDPVGKHSTKDWPNKTTLSYIMNHRLSMNGMKIHHHALSSLMLNPAHMNELIDHCDRYLSSVPGFSHDNFQEVVGNLAPAIENQMEAGFLNTMLHQLSRIHAGAALAFLLLHATLHTKEAAGCITNYLYTPKGSELLTKCNIETVPALKKETDTDAPENGNVNGNWNSNGNVNGSARSKTSPEGYSFAASYHYPDPVATFVGRKYYLSQIMTMLHDKGEHRHLFLYGMSGIGKTELAKKYAVTYRNYYRSIQLLHYRNSLKETICFELLIDNFDDSGARSNNALIDQVFSRKMEALRQIMDDHSLLILDNMNNDHDPDLNTLVELGFPLLVTTQVDFSEKGYQTMMVHALESAYENTSSSLLPIPGRHSQPGRSPENLSDYEEHGLTLQFFQKIYGRDLPESELVIIHNILKKFSGHTFITELLARQMKTSFLDAASMSELLKEHGIFGTRSMEGISHHSSHTPQAVYDYISTILRPDQLTDEEQYILKNLAIMPASGINIRTFAHLCNLSSYEMIWKLTNRSLMILQGENGREILSLHPLIRELVRHNLQQSPEDFSVLLKNLAQISESSWSKPKKYLDSYHDLMITVLNSIEQYSEETLLLSCELLEFSWQYGHFEFVIRQCEKYLSYAATHNYSHQVIGALCRTAGNCLYSAGLVYRKESTRYFRIMMNEYRQVNGGKCTGLAFALKYMARARLYKAVRNYGLSILPCPEDEFGYTISRRFSYEETIKESRQIMQQALQFTDEALALLAELSGTSQPPSIPSFIGNSSDSCTEKHITTVPSPIGQKSDFDMTEPVTASSVRKISDSCPVEPSDIAAGHVPDEKLLNTCLCCKGDIHYIRACIMIYLHYDPDVMLRELDEAIGNCYLREDGILRSLSITAAMTLKAKLLMFKQDYTTCDNILAQAERREEVYRGNDKNTHLIRILIAQGDSAYLQGRRRTAHKCYSNARNIINNYEYLDKGRFYEEAAEKYILTAYGEYDAGKYSLSGSSDDRAMRYSPYQNDDFKALQYTSLYPEMDETLDENHFYVTTGL